MENRDAKYGTNRIASLLFSIAALMALLAVFFTSATAQSLDGLWQSDGYGLLVEIRGGKMSVSQITSISCLPWWTAKRSDSSGNKSEIAFKRGDAVIRLTPGSSSDMLLMRESVSISSMELRRVSARPKNCSNKLADTPQNNYAVFWQTFAEQFALFPLYHTDWAAIDRKYRPRVTASTTPEELFGILSEMILPFSSIMHIPTSTPPPLIVNTSVTGLLQKSAFSCKQQVRSRSKRFLICSTKKRNEPRT